jgi:hypothetical protein
MKELILSEKIASRVFQIRGLKIMIDHDLADLYKVKTWAINQAVKRNPGRFPADFIFRLTEAEKNELITNCDWLASLKHSPHPPYAFTEQGVSMLSSVLRSKRAVLVNVEIMRVFVRLRELLSTHKELAKKLEEMEKKYDGQFKVVFDALRELMRTEPKPQFPPIPKISGFRS